MHRIDMFFYPVLSQLCTVNVTSFIIWLRRDNIIQHFMLSEHVPPARLNACRLSICMKGYSGVYCSALIDDEINFDWSRAEVKPDEILISCCQKYFLDSVFKIVLNENAL